MTENKKKLRQQRNKLKSETEKLIEDIDLLKERYDYSFSDIFRYKDSKIEIDMPFGEIDSNEALNTIKVYYNSFEKVIQEWKSRN